MAKKQMSKKEQLIEYLDNAKQALDSAPAVNQMWITGELLEQILYHLKAKPRTTKKK